MEVIGVGALDIKFKSGDFSEMVFKPFFPYSRIRNLVLGFSWNPTKEGICLQKSEGLSSMERVSEGSTLIINCSVVFWELEILCPQ